MPLMSIVVPDRLAEEVDAIVSERKARNAVRQYILTAPQRKEATRLLKTYGEERCKEYTNALLHPLRVVNASRSAVVCELLNRALSKDRPTKPRARRARGEAT